MDRPLEGDVGLPLSDEELTTVERFTGRRLTSGGACREAWWILGRRAGKSIIAALIVVFATTCCTYPLVAGEVGIFMVIAADRRQARVIRRYVGGLLHASPVLEALISKETRDAIYLTNGLVIEIHTANFRTVRGYTVIGAVCDEIAFWRSEDSANPDREILTALRAAMATVPNALLIALSSPYARRGELWRTYQRHYGKADAPVLVVQGGTRDFNPTVPSDVIEQAREDDPVAASAEYDAEFRRDVETYVSREVVDAATMLGRRELPPAPMVRYIGFTDPAGDSGREEMTLAIAHQEPSGNYVLDVVRSAKPPFSPEWVTKEFADLLKAYRVHAVQGDKYAGEWPREQYRKHGIQYETSEKTKSDIFRDFLPMLTSGRVELLDDSRLLAQLCALERRTGRGGRDVIDHPPNGFDDLVNAAAGAISGLQPMRSPFRVIRLHCHH